MSRAVARTPPVVPEPAAVIAAGRAAGLDAVGVCTAAPFTAARAAIEARIAAGQHADMGFTFRNPTYSTTPTMALRDAKAIVVGALAYRREEPQPPFPAIGTVRASPMTLSPYQLRQEEAPEPQARVAAYAWEEHYTRLTAALTEVSATLRAAGWRSRVVVDDNALVDRAAAVRAGLGWAGKSSNVLLLGRGSWFVLGAVITDAPLVDADPPAVADGCGPCRRCLDGCPTGAIVEPGVVDARRCLSWLLQARGVFPLEHRVALGDRIYGCDDCQEVCPPNRLDDRRDPPGPAGALAQAWVPVLTLLEATDAEILERHGRWYIADRDPRWVRRNALVVLANAPGAAAPAAAERVRALLAAVLGGPDALLAAHAVWAARRLGHDDLLAAVVAHPDPLVQAELAATVPRLVPPAPLRSAL